MSFAHYLLQVNLYLIVFYGFYKLLLDRETYFTLNRFFLVGAGILSICIPFIRLEWLTEQKAAQQVYTSVNWQAVLQQATIISDNNTGLNWGNVFVYLYCAGIVFFLCRLVFNLVLVKKSIRTAKTGSAFSFLTRKVVDVNLPQKNVIDIHEEAHVKQLHTLDILFFEILGVITWLNPIIYLYKKSIKNIHEFLADELAADYQGDKAAYAMLILSQSFGISPNALTNGFFNKSLIKKRIFMLQKERSKKIAVIKYGISIPLFAILIVFSSATVRKNEELILFTDQIPMDKPIELVQEIVSQPAKEVSQQASEALKIKGNRNTLAEKATMSKTSEVLTSTDINTNDVSPVIKGEAVNETDKKIYDFVSITKQPEYPGGIRKFYEYLSKTIRYPELAQEKNVQGKVFLSFIVEKDGSISDVMVTRGLGSGLDEEAVRVLNESPRWNPGVKDGMVVRVKYNINVNFTLTDSETPKAPVKEGKNLTLKSGKDFPGIIVVDGVKLQDNSTLSGINPNNVESVSVLKDQSAINLYGLKAKAGAIIITTKSTTNNLFRKPDTQELTIDKPSTILNIQRKF
ncbi:TonB family protein [Pedobacter frigidisoli]|uniref:TonB family protein n=1 Tax=Pedobacter frigidisoli TaxID=2530455 RepID=UPI00292E68FC|nr:TonB family protein [Pedobacter frigidisoli]